MHTFLEVYQCFCSYCSAVLKATSFFSCGVYIIIHTPRLIHYDVYTHLMCNYMNESQLQLSAFSPTVVLHYHHYNTFPSIAIYCYAFIFLFIEDVAIKISNNAAYGKMNQGEPREGNMLHAAVSEECEYEIPSSLHCHESITPPAADKVGEEGEREYEVISGDT